MSWVRLDIIASQQVYVSLENLFIIQQNPCWWPKIYFKLPHKTNLVYLPLNKFSICCSEPCTLSYENFAEINKMLCQKMITLLQYPASHYYLIHHKWYICMYDMICNNAIRTTAYYVQNFSGGHRQTDKYAETTFWFKLLSYFPISRR